MNGMDRGYVDSIKNFAKKKVLVLGDAIIDEYIYCSSLGKSLSSPKTPKFKYEKTKLWRGGACNVAENLLALGCHVSLITLVGDDSAAG